MHLLNWRNHQNNKEEKSEENFKNCSYCYWQYYILGTFNGDCFDSFIHFCYWDEENHS